MSGWIKLHRKMIDWEWYHDNNVKILFLHLLLTANHKPKRWQGVDILRGQVVVGRKELAKNLRISEQSIRTSLTKLRSTSEITIKSTNKFSIITIVNYDSYQSQDDSINQQINQQPNQQSTNNQPATNHNQERKEDKKEKKIRNKSIKSTLDIPNYKDPTPNYSQPLNEWLAYKASRGQGYKTVEGIRKLVKEFPTTQLLQTAVDYTIARNYQGLVAPSANGHHKPDKLLHPVTNQELSTVVESGLRTVEYFRKLEREENEANK